MAWGAARGIDDILARIRANDPALSSLYLMRQRRFGEADAAALCGALAQNTALRDLSIASHAISPTMAAAVGALLTSSTTLQRLDLGDASFGDEGLTALCPGLAASSSLLQLNLEARGVTASGCAALAEALRQNSSLTDLVLARNAIGPAGVEALAPALQSLRLLDLSGCGVFGGGAIASVLGSTQLETLRLDGNQLQAACAADFSPALRACTSLVSLHLSQCPLGGAGVTAVATNLPASLQTLDISASEAGPDGIAALAAALEAASSCQLSRLIACGCGGDDAALAALIAALDNGEKGAASVEIDLGGNAAGPATLQALAASSRVASACLHDCKLGAAGAEALQEAIAAAGGSFQGLQELDLSANGLESEHLCAVLGALTAAPTAFPKLTLLVIAANPGANEEAVAHEVEALQTQRPGLDVVRRNADTGEGPSQKQ